MFFIATTKLIGDDYMVDVIWDPYEYFHDDYVKRKICRSLHLNIIEMIHDSCILKTFWISIFQRKVKKWLTSRLSF